MKEKCSLLLLFLLVATPLVTIILIPAHWWVLLNIVLFTIIITVAYNMEHKGHAVGKFTQCSLVAGIVCFETVLWGCANFILTNTTISSVDTWQTIGALAASGFAGIAAFATLGKLLHLIQARN